MEITSGLLALGLISGMTYGILAVGLVLVYRSSKIVNFAHGEIGAFGATTAGLAIVRWHLPYWVGLAVGIGISASLAAGTEVIVVRRLKRAPKLMSLVATLGVSQFLYSLGAAVNQQAQGGTLFPEPSGMPEFRIGVLLVTRSYSAMLILSPIIVVGLAVFLRRSRFGLAVRAASANSERALMAGVSAARMSTLAWALAGAIAAVTTMLIIPTRGFISAETLGPVLLLRAMAPAVIARMQSLPVAMGAGVAIGLIDQILIFNYPTSGMAEVVLLAIIAAALLLQARGGGRQQERQDWSALQPWPVLPEVLRRVRGIRLLGPVTAAASLTFAVILGLVSTNSTAVTFVEIIAFSLIGLSLGITTGLGGQLSLGQFALAGVGATASYVAVQQFGNYALALVVAALVSALVSMLLGLPALRVSGLLLGVITLSFALTAQRWLFGQSWALGAGVEAGRPSLGPFSFESTRAYYFWALGVLVIGFLLARNVWRGGIGLRLRAVRDNQDALRAFGVSPSVVKMQGFLVAGLLAGMAGSVHGHLLSRITSDGFDVATSVNTVALVVLGGIGLLAGPILGAFYIIGIPRLLPLDSAGLAATSLGWLLLILYFPGGLAELIARPRERIIDLLARRSGLDPEAIRAGDDAAEGADFTSPSVRAGAAPPSAPVGDMLTATGLVKHFGGVHAVDGVDLTLAGGEILGLLGPNGAGKTTLFELLGGFTTPDAGSVRLRGREIGRLAAHSRAELGLIRSFQDAALFQTLTVLETVMLAHERTQPTRFGASLVGYDPSLKDKEARARELVALMGLDRYRNKQTRELSTGTRRITELACIMTLEPSVLLLDEPSSGIAQRETEALGDLLRRLQLSLGCSMIIIEHDIPLLMGLSDRVMAMDSGRVIAVGTPDEVRNHPTVVESYLGGDIVAIERSNVEQSNSAGKPAMAGVDR